MHCKQPEQPSVQLDAPGGLLGLGGDCACCPGIGGSDHFLRPLGRHQHGPVDLDMPFSDLFLLALDSDSDADCDLLQLLDLGLPPRVLVRADVVGETNLSTYGEQFACHR